MKRHAFSMIELVFVIVILGVLAAVAVPRFVTTRTDAQVAMTRSDIATTLKAVPARIFAENIDPTQEIPTGFGNWGEWMVDTAGLDRSRWQANSKSIRPIGSTGGNTITTCGDLITIDTTKGELSFNPDAISINGKDGRVNPFCKALKDSYPSGSARKVPLATTGAVKF